MFPLSTDDEFSFYFAEVLSNANGGGSNTGEVLRIASQIPAGDIEAFYREFKLMADRMISLGERATAARIPTAARSAYFRAASYYRAADFFLHGNTSDPRLTTLWDAQLAAFQRGAKLLPVPAQNITLQGPGYTIPAYFYPAAAAGGSGGYGSKARRVPTVLACSGYDGSQEALYHTIGVQVLAHGWNFATFEGPGQPTVRRQQGLGFGRAAAWGDVVTPVVDYLRARPDVDVDKVALMGLSVGGSLAPIAAATEHRLAAVVCIDGLYSMRDAIKAALPQQMIDAFSSGNSSAFNAIVKYIYDQPTTPTKYRWLIDQSLWNFDTKSAFDWFTQLGKFDLKGVFEKVKVPVFIGDGQHDTLAGTQARVAWDALGSDKGFYFQFRSEWGAGEHCQIGAEEQLGLVYLSWLDGVFQGNWAKGNGTY